MPLIYVHARVVYVYSSMLIMLFEFCNRLLLYDGIVVVKHVS